MSYRVYNLVESENRLRELQNILENFQCKNHKSYLQQDCEVPDLEQGEGD